MQTIRSSTILTALSLLALASPPASGASRYGSGVSAALTSAAFDRCGTPQPTAAEIRQCRHALEASRGRIGLGMASGTIPLAVHVLTCGGSGDVSDREIANQVAELSRAFAPADLRFELSSVERVDDCRWHTMTPGSAAEFDAKRALAVDTRRRLNLYIVDSGPTLLGWSYLPMSAGPEVDGVVVHYRTLPGGRFEPFHLGRTAVHEIGHYLGLYHTFQNGCDGAGDEVDDTPAEATPATGCPLGRNTCLSPGDDPIHDYMDYSDDACTREFTPGQIVRMHEVIAAYRSELLGWPVAVSDLETRRAGTMSATPLAALQRIRTAALSPGVDLEGAVPNPACEMGVIRFALPTRAHVTLRLRDSDGRTVRVLTRGRFDAGAHQVDWSSASLPNGVYTIELAAKGDSYRRLVLVEHAPDRAGRARL